MKINEMKFSQYLILSIYVTLIFDNDKKREYSLGSQVTCRAAVAFPE